jgi:hypothetical protein
MDQAACSQHSCAEQSHLFTQLALFLLMAVEGIMSAIYRSVRRAQEGKELLALKADLPLLTDHRSDQASCQDASARCSWLLTDDGAPFLQASVALRTSCSDRYKKDKGCRAPGSDLFPPKAPPARDKSHRIRNSKGRADRPPARTAVASDKNDHVAFFCIDVAALEQADEPMMPVRTRMMVARIAASLQVRMQVVEAAPAPCRGTACLRFLIEVTAHSLGCCLVWFGSAVVTLFSREGRIDIRFCLVICICRASALCSGSLV